MKLILLSLVLLMGGMALPFLMVIRLLEPSFVLSFFAYGASLGGLALGSTIAAQHGMLKWRDRD